MPTVNRFLRNLHRRGHQCRLFMKPERQGQRNWFQFAMEQGEYHDEDKNHAGHQQDGESTDDQPTTRTQLSQCGDE